MGRPDGLDALACWIGADVLRGRSMDIVLDEATRSRGLRRVLLVTLALNVAVAVGKIVVGTIAGAIAIRADGFHSSTDGLNNIILLLATSVAAAPPDDDHPYGHRKIEIFAALGIGLLLLGVSWSIGSDVWHRLRSPGEAPRIDALTIGVLVVTLVVNVGVALWERREGQRLQSPALVSDAAHTSSDIAVTIGVLVSTLFVRAGFSSVDAFTGLIVAGFIAWTGMQILRDNARFLADTALVAPALVVQAAAEVPGVTSAGEVRTRGTPGQIFVDLNVRVPGTTTVLAAHDLAHAVEDRVRAKVPGVVDVHVHIEPA